MLVKQLTLEIKSYTINQKGHKSFRKIKIIILNRYILYIKIPLVLDTSGQYQKSKLPGNAVPVVFFSKGIECKNILMF